MSNRSVQTAHEAEELVRGLLDAAPGGVLHVNHDGSIRRGNAEAKRILGLRFDDPMLLPCSALELVREDGALVAAEEHPIAKALATGRAEGPTTLGLRTASGELRWAVFRAEPLRDPDGQVDGAVLTLRDVTEQKRTDRTWSVLVEHVADFVLTCDRDGTIRSINRVLAHLNRPDVVGTSCFDFIDEGSRDEFRRAFERVAESSTPARLETRGIGVGGRMVFYETQLAPLVDGKAGGGASSVLVIARDITERRKMLASLAEKERLASVGMVAASVAHEIMNPLTYVLANLDFVVGQRSDDPARNARSLVEAREGARRMQQIVWDLRSLGRTGSEELFYVDPRSVLEVALRLSGPEVSRTASVVLDLHDVPCVLASESRLCQVFINLLVNAAQAMETRDPSDREIRVETRSNDEADLVGIDVSDTGEGMSAERISRIFEPFFTTKPAGTGLGLSICRDIVERMGGRIDVASTVGVGTTVTVWLSTQREPRQGRGAALASRHAPG
jgi:PAS domain S-box-containing protein